MTIPVRLQYWQSGFYYARVKARSGHVYFAPFVLRAAPYMETRVAVILPTNTWAAYNFRDDDKDGVPNSWYRNEAIETVELSRPFLHRGVPPHFRAYSFLRWLSITGKSPDFYADDDLEHFRGRGLARRYDLIVFPGHHEYVTTHEYVAIEGFYRAGGNLMFLSANNFFRRVIRSGTTITRTETWRELGRAESRWIGVQYVDWYQKKYVNRSFLVVGEQRAPWLFRHTGLRNGDRFGVFGIEIDSRTPESPAGTQVLATIPNTSGLAKPRRWCCARRRRGESVLRRCDDPGRVGTLSADARDDRQPLGRAQQAVVMRWGRRSPQVGVGGRSERSSADHGGWFKARSDVAESPQALLPLQKAMPPA